MVLTIVTAIFDVDIPDYVQSESGEDKIHKGESHKEELTQPQVSARKKDPVRIQEFAQSSTGQDLVFDRGYTDDDNSFLGLELSYPSNSIDPLASTSDRLRFGVHDLPRLDLEDHGVTQDSIFGVCVPDTTGVGEPKDTPCEKDGDNALPDYDANQWDSAANQKQPFDQQDDVDMEDPMLQREIIAISDYEDEESEDSADEGSLYEEGPNHDEDVDMEESPPPEPPIEYNLRPSARVGRQAFVTWVDDDNTGDYDPAAEKAQERKRFKRFVPKSRQETSAMYDDEDRLFYERVDRLSYAAARQNGISFVFTFKFASDAGKMLVNNISDNWPDTTWNVLSDEYVEMVITPEIRGDSIDQVERQRPWNLRHKPAGDLLHAQNASHLPGKSVFNHYLPIISDPADIEVDLFGHPEARGCVQCRQYRLPCTLIEEHGTWPCFSCIEAGEEDCKLLTTPTQKQNCHECQRKKLHCSYYDGSDASSPCLQCQKSNAPCAAAPAPDGIRKRISYDRNDDDFKEPVRDCRPFVTCTACRTARGARCSLKSLYEYPPCNSCKKAGIKCIFDPVPTTSRAKGKKKQTRHEWIRTPEPNSEGEIPASVHGLEGVPDLKNVPHNARIFKTMLHHPIKFLYQPENEVDKKNHPCHFCNGKDFQCAYSILGIGQRYILVQPMDAKKLYYREMKVLRAQNSHYANDLPFNPKGKDRAQLMCLQCTLKRVYVVACQGHEMRPLETLPLINSPDAPGMVEIDARKFDVGPLYNRLYHKGLGPLPKDMWCSLCISPAIYRCCAPQDADMWGEAIDPPVPGKKRRPHDSLAAMGVKQGDGCGLLLCDECYLTMMECNGEVDGVIDELQKDSMQTDQDKKTWPLGERADVEFLRKEGLLMKSVWASGQ